MANESEAPAKLTHEFARVNGVRLHYVQSGRGKLLLFVHGFPEFWYAWRDQLDEFSRDYHAVALDMRGYNLSDKPQDLASYRAKHLVGDLRAFIEQVGSGRAILVAHDWGGAVAWGLAARHPECVEKLVIINAPHALTFARELTHNRAQQQASDYMLLFRDPKAERVLSEDNYRRLFKMTLDVWGAVNGAAAGDAARQAYLAAWSKPGALTGALNYYRASPFYPPAATDPGASALTLDAAQFHVRVPTLVIWGERDRALLPGNLDGLQQHVDTLTIMRVQDGSHWVVHEQPALVNRAIRDFISG